MVVIFIVLFFLFVAFDLLASADLDIRTAGDVISDVIGPCGGQYSAPFVDLRVAWQTGSESASIRYSRT